MENREWMYTGRTDKWNFTDEWREKTKKFNGKYWKLQNRGPNSKEKDELFEKGGGYGFISWFSSLAKRDNEMDPELRKIANGFEYSVATYKAYDVNGYRFHTHEYTQSRPNRKTINSGVLCEGSDGLHYYGRVEGIYELNYGFGKGLNPVVFKCHWFDPRRVKRTPKIGLVEVDRTSVYAGDDVYILATQAFQVFYHPYACKNPKKGLLKWDVVITVSSHNRPPLPNSEDYRRLDPSTYDGEFYQEEGLPGTFRIDLPLNEDMEEEDEAVGMEEDTAQDEVEEVQNQQDLTLLEQFHAGLDNDPEGPPAGYVDDWWGNADSDDDTTDRTVVRDEPDNGY